MPAASARTASTVGIAFPAVAAPRAPWTQAFILVQIAIAGEVVVDADHVGRRGVRPEPVEFGGRRSRPTKVSAQRMGLVHPSAQQVPGQPSPAILEPRLVLKPAAGEDPPEVFGLDQSGGWVPAPDGLHGERDAAALVQQRADETRIVAAVGIPVPVQAAEARRRQRLVDGGVLRNPRIALRERPRIARESLGKTRVEKIRAGRAAAVMEQPDNGLDPVFLEQRKSLVRRSPVEPVAAARRDILPQDGIAQRPQAERRDRGDVGGPTVVPALFQLPMEGVAEAVDRAFDAAPDLQ